MREKCQKIIVYNKNLERIGSHIIHDGWIWEVLFLEDKIYSVSDDGTLRKTDYSGRSEILLKNDVGLFCLTYYDDYIYCGTQSGNLIQFSLSKGLVERFEYHHDIIRKIVIKNGNVITAGEDNRICINGDEVVRHENFVQDVILLKDEIISAGFDGKLIKANRF